MGAKIKYLQEIMQNYYYDIIPEEIRELITEMVEEIIFEEQELQDQEDLDTDIGNCEKLIYQLNFLTVKELTEYCDTLKIKKSRNGVSNAFVKRWLILEAEVKNYKYPGVITMSGMPKILHTRTKKLFDNEIYGNYVNAGVLSWTNMSNDAYWVRLRGW